MKLVKIILEDFLTYDHLEYEFEDKPLLVQGLNLTDPNQKSNGSGKSGIQTGIEFALTAQNSRGVRDSELVTYGRKEASVDLTIRCDVRKETLNIKWKIKAKGSNVVEILINGKEVSFSNVNDGKKYIMDWTAISKEDLFNYFIINKTKFKSFFKSSNREKIELINRFSDASVIEGIEEIDTLDYQQLLQTHKDEITKCEGAIETREELISFELNRDLEAEREELLEDIKDEVEKIKESIKDGEDEIDGFLDEVEEIKKEKIEALEEAERLKQESKDLEAEAKELEPEIEAHYELARKAKEVVDEYVSIKIDDEYASAMTDLEDAESKVEARRRKLRENEERDEKIRKFIQTIDIALSGSITCPSCKHEFLPTQTGDETVEELKRKKEGIQEIEKKNEKEAESLKEMKKKYEERMEEVRVVISSLNAAEKEDNDKKQALIEKMNEVTGTLQRLSTKQSSIIKEAERLARDASNVTLENRDRDMDIREIEADIEESRKKNLKRKEDIKKLKNQGVAELEINKEFIKQQEDGILIEKAKITSYQKLVTETADKIYEMNVWSNNFKQFKMYLANQSLEVIGYHCNRFLQDMGSDMMVEFEGYKMLASGKIKDEITAKIIRGVERTFSSFSGGEQGRLLFASILANRHMINSTHPYGGLDFLSIDEVFEGVDGMGLKHLIRSAQALGISVMIITHVTDEDTADNILTIVKENGVSTIKK